MSLNPAVIIWSPEVSFLFDFSLTAGEMRRRLMSMDIRGLQYRPAAKHDRVLEISPFFRDDRVHWRLLEVLDPDSALYALSP